MAPSEALHAAVLQRLLLNLRLWAAAPLLVQRPFQAMLLKLARVGPLCSQKALAQHCSCVFFIVSHRPDSEHLAEPAR